MSYEYDRSKDPMLAMDYARSDAPRYSDLRTEIESLRAKVAELESELDKSRSTVLMYFKQRQECEDQLAECQKESKFAEFLVWRNRAQVAEEQLTAAQARIAQLRQDLERISNGVVCPEIAARQTLSRTDNMEALNAYRDRVLEDAALICDSHADDPVYCGEAIRALKKGK